MTDKYTIEILRKILGNNYWFYINDASIDSCLALMNQAYKEGFKDGLRSVELSNISDAITLAKKESYEEGFKDGKNDR